MTRFRSQAARRETAALGPVAAGACGAILLLVASGCGLYAERLATPDFTIYSDSDPERVKNAGAFIARAMSGYRTVFAKHGASVPAPLVILAEDDFAQRNIFTNEVRQEGFYFPFLGLIHLSPQAQFSGDSAGNAVVLHELAHHFLISSFPASESCYWLNEGLACALEVSFFDAAGAMVRPYYHLWLHQQARRILAAEGAAEVSAHLTALFGCSWFYFHQQGDKTRNYALAWALTYRLLAVHSGTLEERVEMIMAMSRTQLSAHAVAVVDWLQAEPEEEIGSLARSPALREWALAQWLDAGPVNGEAYLAQLTPLLEPSLPEEDRSRAFGLLASFLGRQVYALSAGERAQLRALVCANLESGDRGVQLAILKSLDRYSRHPHFLAPLVALLESPEDSVRVESARALARISLKPTIASPGFWRAAPVSARSAEVREWRDWLAEFQAAARSEAESER
ncbi:MAG: hypothetical protein L0Z55_02195 [Planctomycetes bacterium]|nr:hypothetical protein [Planctomycetota bacterium]